MRLFLDSGGRRGNVWMFGRFVIVNSGPAPETAEEFPSTFARKVFLVSNPLLGCYL